MKDAQPTTHEEVNELLKRWNASLRYEQLSADTDRPQVEGFVINAECEIVPVTAFAGNNSPSWDASSVYYFVPGRGSSFTGGFFFSERKAVETALLRAQKKAIDLRNEAGRLESLVRDYQGRLR